MSSKWKLCECGSEAKYFRYVSSAPLDEVNYITACSLCLNLRILAGERVGEKSDEWEPITFWRLKPDGTPKVANGIERLKWAQPFRE